MKATYLKKKKLPDAPGVYIFKSRKTKTSAGEILYIGKATSLRDRVRSYFSNDLFTTRGPLLVDMVTRATSLDFIKTDSVLEALVLEAHLIKKHQPKFNTKEKDNRSFNFVIITDEEFPAVKIVRGRELDKGVFQGADESAIKYSFGPFPHGTALREALKIVRKIFPFRDACKPDSARLCFNYQIGLCPGVCVGKISAREYARTIFHIKLFFEGKKAAVIASLRRDMKSFAKKQEFEKAEKAKRTIFALEHIKDVALMKREGNSYTNVANFRIEAYDIAHISGSSMVGAMTVMEDGELKKSDYRKFKIKSLARGEVNDIAALKEVLSRRLGHPEWAMPNLIVADGGEAQKSALESVLQTLGFSIPVVSVVKDERHRAREILGLKKEWVKHEREILLLNEECHRYAIAFHRNLRGKMPVGRKNLI